MNAFAGKHELFVSEEYKMFANVIYATFKARMRASKRVTFFCQADL